MNKILILSNSAGGLYSFRIELIVELLNQGHDVYFVVPQPAENKKVKLIVNTGAKHIQIEMNRRGKNPFGELKLINDYKRVIKEVAPDVILTYTIKPNIYGSYVANKFKVPVIMNITGLGSSFANEKLKIVVKRMYKYACDKAEVIFFQNKSNQDFFIVNNLVDEAKAKLIPGSGVNVEKFVPMEKTVKDDVIRFLFIGRIMKEKGIEEYLQAAETITNKYLNVEFQILGSFEEERYKDMILHKTNEKIRYLGSSYDVRKEIKEIDCIVHPSYHEGMSNVLLEGAAMGKPLIASDIPGCREIIEDGYNGYLFNVKSVKSLEQKLVQFIELDKKSRELMGINSRKKVEREFDRSIVIDAYIKAIDSILKKGDMK